MIAGASCGRRWARLFPNTTGSNKGHKSSSFRSSLSAHSLQSANSLSTVACALTSLGPTCSDEGRVVKPCPSQLPQTHDDGTRRTTDLTPRRLQAHQSLLCSSHTNSAHATMGSTLHVCIGWHSCVSSRQVRERPACLPGKHLPTVVLKAFSLVGGMPMHLTPCRPLGMGPALAILLVNAPTSCTTEPWASSS